MRHVRTRRLAVSLLLMGLLILFGSIGANFAKSNCPQPKVALPSASSPDRTAAVQRLSAAVRLRTLTSEDPRQIEPKPFLELHRLLETSYPRVHRTLIREVVGQYSLLYTWKGTDPERNPILIMAHMDVVPIERGTESVWVHPPFSGDIADGFVWGRGTLDDKASLLGVLEGAEVLIAQGFRPSRTVYLAFGHDEESRGQEGAAKIALLLKSRGVRLDFVLDEGLIIADGVIPGASAPVAMIGTAEKGLLSAEMTVTAAGGHASMPPPQTAIGALAAGIWKLEAKPMSTAIREPARELFACVSSTMPLFRRVAFANLWLFEPLILRELTKSPATNAAVRTTSAVTVARGGTADNVLPISATATVNSRILPGDTTAGVLEHIRHVIDDPRITIRVLKVAEPSPVSSTRTGSFQAIATAVRQIYPQVIVSPGLMIGGTDSVHFLALTDATYRFVPITLTPVDLRRIHGTNERIGVDSYEMLIKFYIQVLLNTASDLSP
jgi:carboxypeptidase PM20D1